MEAEAIGNGIDTLSEILLRSGSVNNRPAQFVVYAFYLITNFDVKCPLMWPRGEPGEGGEVYTHMIEVCVAAAADGMCIN